MMSAGHRPHPPISAFSVPKIIEERCPWCQGAGVTANSDVDPSPKIVKCRYCNGHGFIKTEEL